MGKIIMKARQMRLEYQARIGRLVTAKEVAETIGVTEATLSRIEQGKTERIDFETLRKLCEFYGVTVGDILELVPEKNGAPGLATALEAA